MDQLYLVSILLLTGIIFAAAGPKPLRLRYLVMLAVLILVGWSVIWYLNLW